MMGIIIGNSRSTKLYEIHRCHVLKCPQVCLMTNNLMNKFRFDRKESKYMVTFKNEFRNYFAFDNVIENIKD